MGFIINCLVYLMLIDAILSYFHIDSNHMLYKTKMLISKIQILYIPVRKIIPPRGVDLSPLIVIVVLQLIGRLF